MDGRYGYAFWTDYFPGYHFSAKGIWYFVDKKLA